MQIPVRCDRCGVEQFCKETKTRGKKLIHLCQICIDLILQEWAINAKLFDDLRHS